MATAVRAHPDREPASSTQARLPLNRSNATAPSHTATSAISAAGPGPPAVPRPGRRASASDHDSVPKPSPRRSQPRPCHAAPPTAATV